MNEELNEVAKAPPTKCEKCGAPLADFMDPGTGLTLQRFCVKCIPPEELSHQMDLVVEANERRVRRMRDARFKRE